MKPTLTFVQPFDATFIEKDKLFLEKHFSLYSINQKGAKGKAFLFFQVRLFFFLINALPKSSGVFIWFADYHGFFPVLLAKILAKKSFVIIGGYDATSIPELQYGSFYRPIRSLITTWVVRHADYVLPVAESLGQKLLSRVKTIKGKLVTLPTGYSPTEWYCTDQIKENRILTVASFDNLSRFRLKGLDFFIQVAERMPEYQFLMIGATPKGRDLLPELPSNLSVLDKLPQNQLRAHYSSAKVYAQFSLSEGLPNAVCEAMLCECVPVGTDVGGMKSAVGACGTIIEDQNLEHAIQAIHHAVEHHAQLRTAARQHIIAQFPLLLREEQLLKLF